MGIYNYIVDEIDSYDNRLGTRDAVEDILKLGEVDDRRIKQFLVEGVAKSKSRMGFARAAKNASWIGLGVCVAAFNPIGLIPAAIALITSGASENKVKQDKENELALDGFNPELRKKLDKHLDKEALRVKEIARTKANAKNKPLYTVQSGVGRADFLPQTSK